MHRDLKKVHSDLGVEAQEVLGLEVKDMPENRETVVEETAVNRAIKAVVEIQESLEVLEVKGSTKA
jgi:hypothetical protein